MGKSRLKQSITILLGLCLAVSASARSRVQAGDETAVRALIERYFAAYTKEDLDTITGLWSARSPNLAAMQARLKQVFAANERIETRELRFRQFALDGDRATVLVTLVITQIDSRTKQPVIGTGKLSREMQVVRESGTWKFWSDVSKEEGLAARLAAAKSDSERQAILAEDPELLTPALGRALYQLGMTYSPGFLAEQALDIFFLMQTVTEKLGDPILLAIALNGVAMSLKARGRVEEAIPPLERSVKLREEAGLKHMLFVPLSNVGVLYSRMGNYGKAIEVYQRALTAADELNDHYEAVNMMNLIAQVHLHQANYDLALEYVRRAMDRGERHGIAATARTARSTLAEIYARIGNFDAAIEIQQSILKDEPETSHAGGRAIRLNQLGDTYFAQGNYAAARDYHEQALATLDESRDRITYLQIQYDLAVDYFHIGDYQKTIQVGDQAVSLARQIGFLPELADSLTWVGKAHYALGHQKEARRAFDEAITTIETLRTQVAGGEQERQRFFEGKVSPYYAMVELLIAEKRPEEAFTYAERARGRVLLDVIQDRRATITKSLNASEREQEKRLNDAIAALNTRLQSENAYSQSNATRRGELQTRLEQARLDQRAFQTRLYATHPELRSKRGEAPALTIEQVGALLPDPQTALLEYAVMDDRTYLFALTPSPQNGLQKPVLQVYTLKIGRQDLVNRVEKLRQRLANNDLDYATLASELYNLLVAPARNQLQGKTRLILVPDDALWNMPFQALRAPDGRYLIESAAISYAPSLTVLREMAKAKKPPTSTTLLALGNPKLAGETVARSKRVLMSGSFEPLPEAERLVKELSILYGPKASKVYVGEAAREGVVKAEASNTRILQLATHGVLNNASPMYSHIVLAPTEGGGEDGLLEAWEIMNLELKAELAVLSACETARGRIGAGEGVIGLSWAMFVAGCPTIVVSQWKVESRSTTELMIEMHRQLRKGAGKSEALRTAALKVMADKRTNHPFYWAGFIVVGDGLSSKK